MAVGDVKDGISSIGSGAYLDIRPAAGEEWNLRTVVYSDAVTIELYDGTNSVIFATLTGADIYYCHVDMTNTIRVRVKNAAATTKFIGYTARQIK